MRKLATVATIVGAGLLAAGCGGGGGGTPALQGSVAGPAVVGAQVNVIEIDGTGAFVRTIGQMLTGQGGVFRSDLEIGGPMRLEVPNGFYVDPVTGQSVSIAVEGGLLRAFIPGPGAYSITALTTLAAEITQGSIDDGQPISKAIEDALSLIGDAFEVTDNGTIVRFDALRTSVADLTTSGTAPLALTPETLYATILAGLSQYAATLNTQAGVAVGTISLVDLLGELVKDAKDGSIDGVDASGSQPVNLILSGVPIVPTGQTFGQALGGAITQVEPSLAGLSSQMATTVVAALNQSGNGGTVLLGPTQPTIATVSSAFAGTPNQAHWSGGDQITITGANFQAGVQVYLGVPGGSAVAATDVLIVSSATLTAKLVADTNLVTADAGLRSISVVNTNGTAATKLQALQLVGPPASGLAVQLSTNSQSVDLSAAITGSSATKLVDENGLDVLSGEVVTLSGAFVADLTAGGMTGPALSGTSTTTDGSSNIAFSLSTLSRSTGIYTVTAEGATTGFTSTTAVTFTPGASKTITLTPSPSTVTADGSVVSFTGTVVDQYGNGVVDNTAIALSSAAASTDQGSFPGGTSATTSAKTLSFTYTSPTSTGDGTAEVTATDTATLVAGSSTLTLIPGAPATVTFDVLTPFELSADGTGGVPNTSTAFGSSVPVTGVVTDANGNRVGSLALTVTSTGPIAATGVFQTTSTGTFAFDVHASSAGWGNGAAAQDAKVFVTALGATSAHALSVYPGAANQGLSTLSAPPTSMVAGTSTTIRGVFQDGFGHAILDGTTVTIAHTNTGSTVTSSSAILGALGGFSVPYTASTATGSDDLTITLQSANGTTATLTTSLTIIPDAPFAFDAIAITKTTVSVDGLNSGPQTTAVSTVLRDQYGNPVPSGVSVEILTGGKLTPSSGTVPTGVTQAGEPIVGATLTALIGSPLGATPGAPVTDAATFQVASDHSVTLTSGTITVNPGLPFAGAIAFTGVPPTFTASATPLTVTGTVKDKENNFVLDDTLITVSSTEGTVTGTDADATPGNGFQVKTVSGTFAFDVLLTDSRNDPTFTATALSVPSATITSPQIDVLPPTPFLLVATTGLSTTTLSVDGTVGDPSLTADYTLQDALGVPVPDKTITLQTGGNLAPLTASTTTAGDGTFQFTVTAASLLSPLNSGQTATGTITISEATSPTSTGALAITVFPGVPAAFADIVKPSTPFTATATDFQVTATLKDSSGNTVLDNTQVTVSSTEAVLVDGASLTSTLTVMTTAGGLSFDLRLRDSAKDPTITLTSGGATAIIGPIDVVPAVPATIEITDRVAFEAARLSVDAPDWKGFTVVVKDSFGNPVENADVSLLSGDTQVGTVAPASAKTNAAGTVTPTFTAFRQAATTTVSASVAGSGTTVTTTMVATVVEGALKKLAFTAVNARQSPLRVNEATAAEGAQVEYTGTALDQYDNPVGLYPGDVTFTATIDATTGELAVATSTGSALLSGFSTTTRSGTVTTTDGTFAFYLRGVTKTGSVTVTLSDPAGGASPVTSATSDFFAGEAAEITGFGFTGGSSVVVGQTLAGLTGTVKDRFGNLVDDGTVVDLAAPAANTGFTTSTFSPAAPTTASGVFSADVTAGTEARSEPLTATAQGLTGSPVSGSTATATVTILPGTPLATTFVLQNATAPVNNAPHLTADGACQVTIVSTATITDAYGNAIPTSEVFDVTIEPSGTVGRPTAPATASRPADGELSVVVTAQTATGTFTLTVTSAADPTQTASIDLTLEPMAFARAGTETTSGLSPTLVGMADLDHDGNLDLVEAVANAAPPTVYVSFGDGTGGFSATTTVGVGSDLAGILTGFTLADLEPDGVVDLIGTVSNSIKILPFDRTARSFGSGISVDVVGVTFTDVAVADVNRDGIPDIVGLGTTQVVVLTGTGGLYSGPTTVPVGTGSNARLAIGDVTNTGWPDVVVIDGTDLYLLENDGAGSLATIAPTQIAAAGATSLALADIDRDGDLDLVLGLAGTGGGSVVRVRRNTGSAGSLGASRFTTTFDLQAPAGVDVGSVSDVATADLDRDGKSDIALVFADSTTTTLSRVGVFSQDAGGNGDFSTPMVTVFSFDLRVGSRFALGDLNHDGVVDLAAGIQDTCPTAGSRSGAAVALGLGAALDVSFDAALSVFTGVASPEVNDIQAADVHLDGGDDIIIIRGTTSSVPPKIEVHDYLHGAEVAVVTTDTTSTFKSFARLFVQVSDMNRDGAPDLVFPTNVATAGASKEAIIYPINLGGGLFEVDPGKVTTTTPAGTAVNGTPLAVGPFVRGGGPDVIVLFKTSKEVRVAPGSGASTPSVVVTSTAGFLPAFFGGDPAFGFVGDYNADGAVDVAFAVNDSAVAPLPYRFSVLYGDPADTDGDGDYFLRDATTSAAVISNTQTGFTGYSGVAVGDFDNNGVDDLALLSSGGVSIFSPKPTSTVEQARWEALAEIVGIGYAPTAIAAADFNRDGNLDLVIAQTVDPNAEIRVFLGNGAGLFTEQLSGGAVLLSVSYSTALGPVSRIITPDLNQDGRPDIVVAQKGQVTVFLSQ